jgi:transposase
VLTLPPSVRVFIATAAVDGRKGADSLMAMVRSVFGQDPLSGHLFVFLSRRRDRVRVVYWDKNGFAMWSKRLERGRFCTSFAGGDPARLSAIDAAELALVLEGIDLAGARRRPRWEPDRAA